MSIEDERGFHAEIWILGKRTRHYFDTDHDRFKRRLGEIVHEILQEELLIKDTSNIKDTVQNMKIKTYTV